MANELPVARGLGLAPVHFHLQPWEGGHFLEDAGTGLGTLVNERMVSWVPLQNGDTIRAGGGPTGCGACDAGPPGRQPVSPQ